VGSWGGGGDFDFMIVVWVECLKGSYCKRSAVVVNDNGELSLRDGLACVDDMGVGSSDAVMAEVLTIGISQEIRSAGMLGCLLPWDRMVVSCRGGGVYCGSLGLPVSIVAATQVLAIWAILWCMSGMRIRALGLGWVDKIVKASNILGPHSLECEE
jgi:hypothetical protein